MFRSRINNARFEDRLIRIRRHEPGQQCVFRHTLIMQASCGATRSIVTRWPPNARNITMFLVVIIWVSVTDSRRIPKRPDVINRLSKLFGISRIPVHLKMGTPPQYMTDLYKSVTDVGGLAKHKSPYDADVVRSFPDRDQVEELHFQYHLSRGVEPQEKVLAAEFHVFKMRPRPVLAIERRPPHVIELKLYQVLGKDYVHNPRNLRLLDAKRHSAYFNGWLKFNVTRAVNDWLNQAQNYGFLLTATSERGLRHVNGSYVRFAQRHQHHQSKQPVLVLFTHDAQSANRRYITPKDENYNDIIWDTLKKEIIRLKKNNNYKNAVKLLNENDRKKFITSKKAQLRILRKRRRKLRREKRRRKGRKSTRRRVKREVTNDSSSNTANRDTNYRRFSRRRTCSRQQMYVDFEEIGWSGWIISPKGYNAYHCSGECPFPLGQNQKPTNHATVQSIVNALRVSSKKISTPCCVPDKLYSISLLYFDDEENVILKQYDEMVASSCGCH